MAQAPDAADVPTRQAEEPLLPIYLLEALPVGPRTLRNLLLATNLPRCRQLDALSVPAPMSLPTREAFFRPKLAQARLRALLAHDCEELSTKDVQRLCNASEIARGHAQLPMYAALLFVATNKFPASCARAFVATLNATRLRACARWSRLHSADATILVNLRRIGPHDLPKKEAFHDTEQYWNWHQKAVKVLFDRLNKDGPDGPLHRFLQTTPLPRALFCTLIALHYRDPSFHSEDFAEILGWMRKDLGEDDPRQRQLYSLLCLCLLEDPKFWLLPDDTQPPIPNHLLSLVIALVHEPAGPHALPRLIRWMEALDSCGEMLTAEASQHLTRQVLQQKQAYPEGEALLMSALTARLAWPGPRLDLHAGLGLCIDALPHSVTLLLRRADSLSVDTGIEAWADSVPDVLAAYPQFRPHFADSLRTALSGHLAPRQRLRILALAERIGIGAA